MATAAEVEHFKVQLAAAEQAAAEAQQQTARVQQQAEQEVKRIRDEAQASIAGANAAGAANGAASLDSNGLAIALVQAMASAGIGVRAPREERDEQALSGKKVGRAMPLYKGEGGDHYLRFERKFKAWAEFNKLTEADKKTQLYLAFDGSAEQIVDVFGPESSVFRNNSFEAYADQIKSLFATRAQSEAAKSAFDVTAQLADENVQQYAAKKMSKFLVAYPGVEYTSSEYLIRVFIKDLRSDKVKEQVVLRGGSKKTFEEVVTEAANVEAGFEVLENMKAMKGGHYGVKVTPPKATTTTTEEPMELGALMATLQPLMKDTADSGAVLAALQQQFRPQRDQHGRFLRGRGQRRGGPFNPGNNKNCWDCNEPGHFQRECPKSGNNGGNRGRYRGNGGRGNAGRGRGGWRGYNAMENEKGEFEADPQRKEGTQLEGGKQAGEKGKTQDF